MKIFSTVIQKFSTENRDTPPLSLKIFDIRKFLKHLRVPLRSFLSLWDRKNRQNRDTLLCKKFFDSRIFLKHRRVSQRNVLVLWDKKISTKNRAVPHLFVNFFDTKINFFETQKGSPANFFGTMRQKNSGRKLWYPPLIHKIFRYSKLSEESKGSPRNFFGNFVIFGMLDEKFSTENRDKKYRLHKK